jgi:hypothetical protein
MTLAVDNPTGNQKLVVTESLGQANRGATFWIGDH